MLRHVGIHYTSERKGIQNMQVHYCKNIYISDLMERTYLMEICKFDQNHQNMQCIKSG